MGSAPKSLEFGGGRRGTDSAEPFLSSIFKKQSEIFARKCYFDPFGNHESFRSDALCSEWDPNLREMGMEPLGKLLGAGMEPQPGLLGLGSRWGWIHTPTLSPHGGTSGGAQGVPPALVTSSSQYSCAWAGGLRSRGPVAFPLQTQTPLLCNVPAPHSKSPGKRAGSSLPSRGDPIMDQEGGEETSEGASLLGARRDMAGEPGALEEPKDQEGPEEPGGTIRDKASGPGAVLSHQRHHQRSGGLQDRHCHQVGAPEDTAATGKQPRGGWERPGETCSPALCCMTVIKLLAFVMVPRGGVNQLLIKTDGSEVASPEPLYPWNFGKSHRGARSHRADPRHPRSGGTAASTRPWWGQISSAG